MAAAGIHRLGREEGTVGGRENCTLRRFRIRGLIEGMLRTVMGNICQGSHKAQVASGAIRSQGKGRQEARERKQGSTGKGRGEMGEGYGGKREIEHEIEKQGNGTAKERKKGKKEIQKEAPA